MADTHHDRIQQAWQTLWDSKSPLYLPKALSDEPIAPGFADTGPIILFNREPWRGVSIDLRANTVSGLGSAQAGKLSVDGDHFKAELTLNNLQYAGRYVLQSGSISGSAVETAGAKIGFFAASADDGSERDDLADSYQDELMQSENGRFMVGTYHQFNDCYNEAVTTGPTFNWIWPNHKTNNKTSEVFAGQTNTAAQTANRSTAHVNGDPDYNFHSFFMQTALKANLQFLSEQANKAGDKAAAQRFLDAGLATSTFRSASVDPSQNGQTVDEVINLVHTSKPPTAATDAVGANNGASLRAVSEPEDVPEWLAEADRQALALHEKLLAQGHPKGSTSGHTHRGTFNSRLQSCTLTLSGQVSSSGIQVDAIHGNLPEVAIQISHFPPGDLYQETQDAIDRANFLKGVLGKRILSALGDEKMLSYLSKLLSAAA